MSRRDGRGSPAGWVALGLALGMLAAAPAAAAVYAINRSLPCTAGCTGAFTISGTITTDGATGTLIVEDIIDHSLTFTVPGQPGVLVEGDDVITAFGTQFPTITATPTTLSFAINNAQQGISFGNDITGNPGATAYGYIIGQTEFSQFGLGETLYALAGDKVIALASVALTPPFAVTASEPGPIVPLPAALPLLATALAALGVVAGRRRASTEGRRDLRPAVSPSSG